MYFSAAEFNVKSFFLFLYTHTLEPGIDVGQGINIGPGNFGKSIYVHI